MKHAPTARPGARPRYPGLTPHQRKVLMGVIAGEMAHETARRMHISLRTVETHRRNLKERLGARTLPHAVALWLTQQHQAAATAQPERKP